MSAVSTLRDDVIVVRSGKIAQRIGDGLYNAPLDLYGLVQVQLALRATTARRFGGGKSLAITSRVLGGNVTLTFASPNLPLLAEILAYNYTISGPSGERVGKMPLTGKTLPYVGFIGGMDDDAGKVNGVHLFLPKLKPTSDTIEILNLSGNEQIEYSTLALQFEAVVDSAYNIGAQNEIQSVDITGTPTGGDFTLLFGADETAAIDYDADASEVQAALEDLNNIGSGNVSVTGTNPNFAVTFQGSLANSKLPLLTANADGLTGGNSPDVTITRDQEGDEGEDMFGALYDVEAGTSPTLPPAF